MCVCVTNNDATRGGSWGYKKRFAGEFGRPPTIKRRGLLYIDSFLLKKKNKFDVFMNAR